MPSTTSVTCDICGSRAEAYPSFFQITNENEGYFVGLGAEIPGVIAAPSLLKVDTRGCRRYNLHVYLCQDHFTSLTAACESWFAEAVQT